MRAYRASVVTASLAAMVVGCTLLPDILDRPLTEEEERFLGTWTLVIGIGNTSTWEFNEHRNARHRTTNLVWGDTDNQYIWEADGGLLTLYERDTYLAKVVSSYEYSFPSEGVLALGVSQYERQ